jgi:hypothetical protein
MTPTKAEDTTVQSLSLQASASRKVLALYQRYLWVSLPILLQPSHSPLSFLRRYLFVFSEFFIAQFKHIVLPPLAFRFPQTTHKPSDLSL